MEESSISDCSCLDGEIVCRSLSLKDEYLAPSKVSILLSTWLSETKKVWIRSKQATDALKFGIDPIRLAIGDATRATMDRAVNASETVNASGPDLVQNTAAVITTAGVIWSEKLPK